MGNKYISPPITDAAREFHLSEDSTTTPFGDVLNNVNAMNVNIPNSSEVIEYLSEYDDIIDVLYCVCKLTREKFGQNSELALEVFHDPEHEYRNLTLYVRKEHYEDNILDKLEELDGLYGDLIRDKKGYILVTTDFSRPRFKNAV